MNAPEIPEDDRGDVAAVLDEELGRLPQRYRAALVACELERDGVTVRPGEARGGITLMVDPSSCCDVRGMAVDWAGKRIKGATVRLWWGRRYTDANGGGSEPTMLESFETTENGWFVFRGRWRGFQYSTEVETSGHVRTVKHLVVEPAEATHDVGKIVLSNTNPNDDGHTIDPRRPRAGRKQTER